MDTVEPHNHEFDPEEWPFSEADNVAVFSSARVMRQRRPILMVYHNHDSDWQFLHGYVEDDDECLVVCLGCIFCRDKTVGQLANLPVGWMASRDSVGAPWQREPYEADAEDD